MWSMDCTSLGHRPSPGHRPTSSRRQVTVSNWRLSCQLKNAIHANSSFAPKSSYSRFPFKISSGASIEIAMTFLADSFYFIRQSTILFLYSWFYSLCFTVGRWSSIIEYIYSLSAILVRAHSSCKWNLTCFFFLQTFYRLAWNEVSAMLECGITCGQFSYLRCGVIFEDKQKDLWAQCFHIHWTDFGMPVFNTSNVKTCYRLAGLCIPFFTVIVKKFACEPPVCISTPSVSVRSWW